MDAASFLQEIKAKLAGLCVSLQTVSSIQAAKAQLQGRK